MSEKRFSETVRNCYYTSLVFDKKTQEELGTSKVVGLLNEQQATIESLKKDLKIWYVELMLNTPREHSLWVEDVVEKYSFLKELDDE